MANDAILKSLIVEDLSGTLRLGTPGGWRPTVTGIALSFDRAASVARANAILRRSWCLLRPADGSLESRALCLVVERKNTRNTHACRLYKPHNRTLLTDELVKRCNRSQRLTSCRSSRLVDPRSL